MGMTPRENGRSRFAREGGWLGKRRTYKCRMCGDKFQVDTKDPLPLYERKCPKCKDISLAISVANHCGDWSSFKK